MRGWKRNQMQGNFTCLNFSVFSANDKIVFWGKKCFWNVWKSNHKELSAIVCNISEEGRNLLHQELLSNVHYIFNVFSYVNLWTSSVGMTFVDDFSGCICVLELEFVSLKINYKTLQQVAPRGLCGKFTMFLLKTSHKFGKYFYDLIIWLGKLYEGITWNITDSADVEKRVSLVNFPKGDTKRSQTKSEKCRFWITALIKSRKPQKVALMLWKFIKKAKSSLTFRKSFQL